VPASFRPSCLSRSPLSPRSARRVTLSAAKCLVLRVAHRFRVPHLFRGGGAMISSPVLRSQISNPTCNRRRHLEARPSWRRPVLQSPALLSRRAPRGASPPRSRKRESRRCVFTGPHSLFPHSLDSFLPSPCAQRRASSSDEPRSHERPAFEISNLKSRALALRRFLPLASSIPQSLVPLLPQSLSAAVSSASAPIQSHARAAA